MNNFEHLFEKYKIRIPLFLKLVFGYPFQYNKIALAVLFTISSTTCYGQTKEATASTKSDLYGYVDIAPLFFVAPAATLGAGIEYDRFQLGVLAIRGNKLPDSFKNLVFENAQKVEFDKSTALEIVFKTYYKKSRKGFYLGGLANFSKYRAVDKSSGSNKTFSALNLDSFIGYRWFPFKKYLYIDPALGFTTNVNKKENLNFVGNTFQFKSGFGLTPFLFVGVRFPLFKENSRLVK